ncbi:MAG: polyprenyl synthetase family protein [Proteobacteria bacterium]|jgi:octaprenyl-diphosphate synthase|nr:polyprenyl synthetase family protein [Pseudomonadota bacterium]
MDALEKLRAISEKHSLNGAVAEAMTDTAALLGDGLEALERVLSGGFPDAPGGVREACRYMLDAGGKRIRPAICLLSFRAARGEKGRLPVALATACELLHNATLLHDDVIDEGDVRRGRPAVRVVYGNAISILGGDYLLTRCVETVAAAGAGLMPEFVATLRRLVEGEVTQLELRGSLSTTREQYFRIVEGKTASLFRWAAFSGAKAAGAGDPLCAALGEFGWHVGVAFQLVDDVLDFSTEPDVLGKSLNADIREGKMTLPLIVAAAESPALRGALAELIAGADPATLAPRIASDVRRAGALETALAEASANTSRATEALRRAPGGDGAVIEALCTLADALQRREM